MKKFIPITSSQRHTILINKSHLWKGKPFKKLSFYSYQTAGRNNTGHITIFHRGSGHKRKIRVIDFNKNFFGIPCKLLTMEFDPNRSSFISLIVYKNVLLHINYLYLNYH